MRVKFWGTRGSIPTPGEDTVKYGGNTTCVELILNRGDILIFDAGTGIRKLGLTLMKRGGPVKTNLLFSHYHWDHIQGFPFFLPAYNAETEITIYGCSPGNRKISLNIFDQMEISHFPVDYNHLKAKIEFQDVRDRFLQIGEASIFLTDLCHPGGGVGFRIEEGIKKLVFLTDNELFLTPGDHSHFEKIKDFCQDADFLIHDAQYKPEEIESKRGWGHSTYTEALQLALNAGVKKLVLFHHEPERPDEEVDEIVEFCREEIKERGSDLICFGAQEGREYAV
ncbi:MBL fold metallo-hydrolase [candidate division KSB1 bacterium]|nr:MBL fold metallo-hydrolase [candidate division KSB1 bacterium]